MGRLTIKTEIGYFCNYECCTSDSDCGLCDHSGAMTRKLGNYEDLEEECIKECGCGLNMLTLKYKEFLEHMHELAAYEDLEEQGLLLRLPCAVGDTVYKVWYKPCHNGEDYPDSYTCCGCDDECDLELTIFDLVVPSLDWILNHIGQFGDYVWFLTREEAEKALEERRK